MAYSLFVLLIFLLGLALEEEATKKNALFNARSQSDLWAIII